MTLTSRQRLEIDSSITTYTFEGGVEQRRPWRPFARLAVAAMKAGDALGEWTMTLKDLRADRVYQVSVKPNQVEHKPYAGR